MKNRTNINMKIKREDEYGVINYSVWFKIIVALVGLYTYIFIMAIPLYNVEKGVGNIKNYEDAFWLLQMACSTIGFGDVYPVTQAGRWIVAGSFYIGVGVAGYIGGTIADVFTGFTDNSVKNRELRKQNDEILKILKDKR